MRFREKLVGSGARGVSEITDFLELVLLGDFVFARLGGLTV